MCSDKQEIVLGLFQQIEKSISLLQQWNKDIKTVDDYLLSPEGMKNLAATCMLIEAIGESIKKIDRNTNGNLLPLRPEIPWKHRSFNNFIANALSAIAAYCFFEKKPAIDVDFINDRQLSIF